MNEVLDFLARHGAAVVFIAVFVEQLGIPLPATPWLLAAGALAAGGKISGFTAFISAALGSIIADSIWFYVGRRGGHRILKLLCRISLEPDSCARRTQDLFARWGMRGVLAGKFIPGFSVLVSPLAGSSGVSAARFFFFDGIGALLYSGLFVLLGILFAKQLDQIFAALAGLGHGALGLIVASVLLYIGFKFYQRHRLLRDLRTARISVDELWQMMEAGEQPVIIDLRSQEDFTRNPALIRGAVHVTINELENGHDQIPRDREIVLYCSCPNEVSSARVALLLIRKGIGRVRPLLGGIDAWRTRDFPMEIASDEGVKRNPKAFAGDQFVGNGHES